MKRATEINWVIFRGVLDGVLGELHERLGQALAVGDDDAVSGGFQRPFSSSQGLRLGMNFGGERGYLDRLEIEEVGLL